MEKSEPSCEHDESLDSSRVSHGPSLCICHCHGAQVYLEKGYSQVDWLRRTKSGEDLNGLQGKALRKDIPMDEVKLHKTEDDAWMVLRGKVYNITPYLKYHPGGIDILVKVAGKDGTGAFNKYHPWVNADALLEKCLIGSLAVAVPPTIAE